MEIKSATNYDGLESVRAEVEKNNGVMTMTMGDLRDAYGKGRLGKYVLDGISKRLAGLGVGHYPRDLPGFQHEFVRLYKLGSPIGDIVDAVLSPNEDNDELLRQKSAGDDAELLRRVREIVCR